MHHSNLSKLRKRFGLRGIEAIKDIIFKQLKTLWVYGADKTGEA